MPHRDLAQNKEVTEDEWMDLSAVQNQATAVTHSWLLDSVATK